MGRAHSAAARTTDQETAPAEEQLTEGLHATVNEAVVGARAELAALGERAGLAAAREALRARREEAGGDDEEAGGPFAWLRRQREENPAGDEPAPNAEATTAETRIGEETPATAAATAEQATSGGETSATTAATTAEATIGRETSATAPTTAYAAPPPATSAEATTPTATAASLTPEPGAAALAAETPAPVLGLLTGIKDGAVDELVGVRDFVVGVFHHTNPLAWETYKATWASTFQTAAALFQDPTLLLTALVEPYKAAYAEGGGFQAAGRLIWDVATLWSAPTKVMRALKITSRVGDLAKAAGAAGKAGTLLAASAPWFLPLGRVRSRFATVLEPVLSRITRPELLSSAERVLKNLERALSDGLLPEGDPTAEKLVRALDQANERHMFGPFAELGRYLQLLIKGDIAPGTEIGIGVRPGDKVKGLPDVDGAKELEIDAYYKTRAGVLVAEEIKASPRAFARKVDAEWNSEASGGRGAPRDWEDTMRQPKRYGDWAKLDAEGPPREVRYVILADEPVFGEMLNPNIYLEMMKRGISATIPFTVGPHTMTLQDLLDLSQRRKAVERAQSRLPELNGKSEADLNHQLFNNVELARANLARLEAVLANAP
jgi:hypothetical protein